MNYNCCLGENKPTLFRSNRYEQARNGYDSHNVDTTSVFIDGDKVSWYLLEIERSLSKRSEVTFTNSSSLHSFTHNLRVGLWENNHRIINQRQLDKLEKCC